MPRAVLCTVVLCLVMAAVPAAASARLSVDFTPDSQSLGPGKRLATTFTSNEPGTFALYLTNSDGAQVYRRDGRMVAGTNVVSLIPLFVDNYRLRLEAHYGGQEDGDVQPVFVTTNPKPRPNPDTRLRVSFAARSLSTSRSLKTTARFSSTLAGRATALLTRNGSGIKQFDMVVRRGSNKVSLGRLPVGTYLLSVKARLGSQGSTARQSITVRK